MIHRRALSAVVLLTLGACTSRPQAAPTSSTMAVAPTEAELYLPAGEFVAVPIQDRKDVPKGLFGLKLVNGSEETVTVTALRLDWPGLPTALVGIHPTPMVPGEQLDMPLPLPPAVCVGDGRADTMPSLATTSATLSLDDGTQRRVPVVDQHHVAQRLYLADCERQFVERQVGVSWAAVTADTQEGRPVSAAVLRLARGEATGAVRVLAISNTVNFSIDIPDPTAGAPLLELPAGIARAELPVRFLEGRCDSHALSESSQPFSFVVRLDLGDGAIHTLVVPPDRADQRGMLERVQAGCTALGKLVGLNDTGSPLVTVAP